MPNHARRWLGGAASIPACLRNGSLHCLSAAWLSLLVSGGLSAESPPPSKVVSKDQTDFFESKIRPLLVDHCYECHSQESGESGGDLFLDTAASVLRGGAHGPALVPENSAKSLLILAISYQEPDLEMPPDGKLDDASIETLRQWIEIGAPDPRSETGEEPTKSESPLDRDPLSHWAFRLPQPARLNVHDALNSKETQYPNAQNLVGRLSSVDGDQPSPDSLSRDLIDSLARRRSLADGLKPNGEAAKATLVRRLYFDLTGLPPSQEVIRRYERSERVDAYQRLVDSLLATPAFGERFARHWMDVSRYADTLGYATGGKTRRYTGSERFRDWAIRAFATDMPYDEMLRHQLAGDRTDPNNDSGNLDAMGFLTLGRSFLNRLDTIDDRIDVISRGLMGMTVTCARCHDHKFDPISTSDYYSLAGIIFSSDQPTEGASPLMMVDKKNPIDSPILIRGQIGNRGKIAPRQFLAALRKPGEPRFTDGSGRWELVQRIASAENPLTSRVMVNRLWGHLIGKPLVDSPSDFGYRTQPPEVVEVLDDLAAEFARHWSIKRIVRRIVLSRIYRQSSATDAAAIRLDADNRFLSRANRKRRDFESLRDSILSVAGSLDRSLGGAPVEITLETTNPRRTVYAMIDRQNLPPIFRTFDFSSPDTHSPGRYFTTVPQQSLFLMNNRQSLDLAGRTARVVRAEAGSSNTPNLIRAMFRRVLGRNPSDDEQHAARDFLNQPATPPEQSLDPRALWSYGTATTDEDGKPIDFTPLSVFKNNRWQFESQFPSPGAMGHAYLGKESGHTPNIKNRAVVRRFTAPVSGNVKLIGTMGHRSDKGDGFQAGIWIAGQRIWQEVQKSNDRPYGPLNGHVEKGQTIDLVASPGESSSHDTFYWNVKIRLVADDQQIVETDSIRHFSGPFDSKSFEPLDRLAQLAQTLLMSNEFAFVD